MYKALGRFPGGNGYSDISFRHTELWDTMPIPGGASRVAGTALSSSAILFGDEQSGPVVLLLALAPGIKPPDAPAHTHASDNWRMSVLGNLPMGPDSYDAGHSRFQEGWKPYASDNYANGPDGGWTALMFADRRGTRVRHVKQHDGPVITPMDRLLAEWLGVGGDLVAEEPECGVPGPSVMATTLDDFRRGARINVSFHDTEHWLQRDGVSAMAGALGDHASGPIVMQVRGGPDAEMLGQATFECDLLRLVARGSYTIDDREYQAGDIRVQAAGVAVGRAVAGSQGADEVVIFADRRAVGPQATAVELWSDMLARLGGDLARRLADSAKA
ncbi:MAG: hypothetical protein Q8K63_10095 [Acidimicrobiales bacterium]|nr:hypothetical protein [Acidimicrobiales bacterium]